MARVNIALLCVVFALASGAAYSQTRVLVRGTIAGLTGDTLMVKAIEGRETKVELKKDAAVYYPKGGFKRADIKPGMGMNTAAVEGPDGKLVSREVRIFPPEREVTNPGHRPMSEPKTTMTNATVSASVQTNNGREVTLAYKGGSTVVVVPENLIIVMPMEGDRSHLAVGETVRIQATMDNDGKLTASTVLVSKDGVKPQQ
jgi:hypothetical protein